MALPTKTDLQTMDYAFQAQPFVANPAAAAVAVELGAFYQQLNPLGFNMYRAGQVRGG